MAGLTREQRAAKAAANQNDDDSASQSAGLVAMRKDGEIVYVHPTCVKSHQDAGWQVIND